MVSINESMEALKSVGVSIPNWIYAIILIIIILAIILKSLTTVFNFFNNILKAIKTHFYDRETKQFVEIRNTFVEHLDSEVKRLNREADWNDFHYTELEAEVEVDLSLDLDVLRSRNPIIWLRSLFQLIQNSKGISPALKVQKNLIHAIMHSKSPAFLVIGDPGSGKTVSLRHLFREMAKRCSSSKDKAAIVPIYLNLKQLNLDREKVDANRIHDWVVEQLRADQDRTIHEFLDNNFEQMLKDGAFFFLFDSFDEIPAVMDAQEEEEVVRLYATALDRFLHSQHRCRGLVSSRPYRAPKIFIGQKMVIRPLSNNRIKKALNKYMGQALADQLWQELVQKREDMLYIAQNPFYLGLLARYSKEKQRLPERHYDLFEHFVQTRAQTDESRLSHFGLTSSELIERASILAFAMTRTPHIGLEANIDQTSEITLGFDETSGWNRKGAEPLLHALAYSKLGRLSREEPGKPRVFSFVHRRFHEYFCARYLKQNPIIAPFENLAADDRWREILVLLCEVLPGNHLTRIFDSAQTSLMAGINAESGSIEHRNAIETIRFLKDGFHNRINELPNDIRVLCSKFIQKQLKTGTILDQKRAIEGVSLADDESVNSLLELALTSDSMWLRETALRSCRILREVPEQITKAMQRHLYHRYVNLEILNDYTFYSVLFSSSPALFTFKYLLRILAITTVFQILLYSGIAIYAFKYDMIILTYLFSGVVYTIYKRNFFISTPYGMITSASVITFVGILISKDFWLFSGNSLSIIFATSVSLLILNIFLLKIIYPPSPRTVLIKLLYIVDNSAKILNDAKTSLLKFLMDLKSNSRIISIKNARLILIYGLVFSLLKSASLARELDFSIEKIYSAYGFTIASLIILSLLLGITFIFYSILKSFEPYMLILLDQSKLAKLYYISDSRPTTATEAILNLKLLKSDVGKTQYLQSLFKWLPVGTEPYVFIEEATKHRGAVRDKLYQLAEIWEDSMRRKR